ncbi:MAG: hypothetical protein OXG35_12795 [Acidobacteria bacterium]|nr:hypothetical protein [Acidobacteriota bacterium]
MLVDFLLAVVAGLVAMILWVVIRKLLSNLTAWIWLPFWLAVGIALYLVISVANDYRLLPRGVDLTVDDQTFSAGDDIALFATNHENASVIVMEAATLRVDETWCDVAIQGNRILDAGETGGLTVDGSRRVVTPDFGEHQCELRYTVLDPRSGQLVDRAFEFSCQREFLPNLTIEEPNLC